METPSEAKPAEVPAEGEDLIPKENLPQDKPGTEGGEKPPTETPAEETPAAPAEETPAETPAPSGDRTVEEVPKKEPVSEVPLQPAPVPGETGKENALRLEVTRLRTKLRSETVKEVVDSTIVVPDNKDPYEELRKQGYTDEEISKMEVAVDLIAKQKGYVRADDSYKTSVQDSIDGFIDDHPEYSPAKDVDDLRWGIFRGILKEGIYNLAGKTPRQLKAIFSKVDDDVKKELGEPITVKATPQQIAAQQHKVNIASHSGGTASTPIPESKLDYSKPIGGIVFKGFDTEDK